jgi:hypothetical protein
MGEEILELCFGVRDLSRKTNLVEPMQPDQVLTLTITQPNHSPQILVGFGNGHLGCPFLRLYDDSVVESRGQQAATR